MWQLYYEVKQIDLPTRIAHVKNNGKWAIFTGPDSSDPGKVVYQVYYRNQRLAERGAARFYERTHGKFEKILLGN